MQERAGQTHLESLCVMAFQSVQNFPKNSFSLTSLESQKPILKETGRHLFKAPGVTGLMMVVDDDGYFVVLTLLLTKFTD